MIQALRLIPTALPIFLRKPTPRPPLRKDADASTRRKFHAPASPEAGESKAGDIVRRRAGGREVGENLADHGRELEAVAGAGRSDDDVRGGGQAIDQEIAVWRHGVEAGPSGHAPAVRGRPVGGTPAPEQGPARPPCR